MAWRSGPCRRRIDKYLEGDLPQAQRSRLEAEKEVLRRLPEAYTLTLGRGCPPV